MENEGQAVNRPPLFKGNNYDYWKQRMIAFFDASHIDMYDVVEKGDYIPMEEGVPVERKDWSDEQKLRYLLNSKARNAMMCALSEDEYAKVHSFKSAKQMWDTLAIAYEGSSHVKRNKLSLLARQYECFTMEETENIQSMFGRFQTILNELKSLGRTYDNYDNIDKILRSLSRTWRPQVTALRASRDLTEMTLEELIGILKVHELELLQDEGSKKGKSLALNVQKPGRGSASRSSRKESSSKAMLVDESSDEQTEEDDSDEDEISFISRKIRAMWKKKGGSRMRNFNKRNDKEKKEKSPVICYECKKPGHFKSECPNLKKDKKKMFFNKKKGLMATWEDLDGSTTSEDESGDEEANLCLMADTEESAEFSGRSSDDDDEVNSSEPASIEEAYHELLAYSSTLSRGYRKLKKNFLNISKENHELKEEINSLKKTQDDVTSENKLLKEKVDTLKISMSKFVEGSENLEKILRYSRHPSDKSGIGYEGPKKEFDKKIPSCSKCGKSGHVTSKCRHLPKRVPSNNPKTNKKGPKSIWVPKNKIIPVADVFNSRKTVPVMVPGQWLLTTHDGRKVYVPRPPDEERRPSHIWRKSERKDSRSR